MKAFFNHLMIKVWTKSLTPDIGPDDAPAQGQICLLPCHHLAEINAIENV